MTIIPRTLLIALSAIAVLLPSTHARAQARPTSFGSAKIQSRLFNPFEVTRTSRLRANPFGLPAGLSAFQTTARGLFDPYAPAASSNSDSSNSEASAASPEEAITVAPVAGSQTAPTTISTSSSSVSFFRRPIRSPYRPPPRGPFGP